MTVVLHWDDRLPSMTPGTPGPRRWATYASLHDALTQAAADDGLSAVKITADEEGDEVLASKADIDAYAKRVAALEDERDKKLEAAHAAHAKAVVAAAGGAE